MYSYVATFVPGFGEVVKKTLLADFPSVEVQNVDETTILFSGSLLYGQIAKKKYFTNVFMLLSKKNAQAGESDYSVVRQLYSSAQFSKISSGVLSNEAEGKPLTTFRLMVQKGSRLVHIPKDVSKKILDKVSKESGLKFSPLKSDVEIWLLLRDDGKAYGTAKFTRFDTKSTSAPVQGELRPHLAHVLNLLSQPAEGDTYLDPFAGFGSLPFNRAIQFPYTKIIAIDKDSRQVNGLHRRFKHLKNITVQLGDALNLTAIQTGSVDAIVTDPPWGIFDMQDEDYSRLYTGFLNEAARVLKKTGKLVVLTAQKDVFANCIASVPQLKLESTINTLINGKKAGVFVLSIS